MLSGAFSAGFNLDNFKSAMPSKIKEDINFWAFTLLVANSLGILILNMVFQAVLTAKLIRPAIKIKTSNSAVFNPSYGLKKSPHVLFRLINASPFDLYSVSLRAFLTVHDDRAEAPEESMTYYFPIEQIDPADIPILKSFSPWIVAIPTDVVLKNSIIDNYEPVLTQNEGSHRGKRELELLIEGYETEASSSFMRAIRISLETANMDAGLACGRFQSLPTRIEKGQLVQIDKRNCITKGGKDPTCSECRFYEECRFA